MQKKSKLIKKMCIATILIFSILISTMPYKPKIVNKDYNAKKVNAKISEMIEDTSSKSNITINKIDSKTEEPLEGVKFELTPIEDNIIDNMKEVEKYSVGYYISGNLVKLETYYGETYAIVSDSSWDNIKGWSLNEDANDIAYVNGDIIYVNQDIQLYAVRYELQYFYKDLVKSESELPLNAPENLPTITYIGNAGKVQFVKENSPITLLYKLTARGDAGLKYKIQDTGAEYAFGDPLSGTIPESGEINCYVTKDFLPSDINYDGNIVNTAQIIPGTYDSSTSSSTKIIKAEDNTPSYTVTYSDSTPDGTVFETKAFTGIKYGERTPTFTGNLKRDGYEFMGWAPALCETVEYDMDYFATWMKRAELFAVILPVQSEANVGDTISWKVEIFNSQWADAYNVKLEGILNNGKVIFNEENIFIEAGGKFVKTIEYVVTEEDIGKTLNCEAKVTDFGDEQKTATPHICSGSHTTGIIIFPKETKLSATKNANKVPGLLKSFNSERAGIFNEKSYAFIKDENGVYKSSNQGIGSSESRSYIPIDLSNYSGKYTVEINASISSEQRYDYGYAKLIEQEGDKVDFGKDSIIIFERSGNVQNETYRIELEGGKKYNILFGYVKDSSVDDGDDVFTINSVKIIFNSEGLKEKISLVTDSTGKIVTEIPNGRYILTEVETAEGYKILEHPIIIDVQNNEIKIIENNNLDNITISNNNELKIENTTSRAIVHYYLKNSEGGYTQTKLKQDKIIKGIEGSEYSIEPLLCIQKDGTDYELEYEIENGTKKYITPENQTGILGMEDINVNYYYQAKKRIVINKIWVDNNNSLGIRPDFINVILKAEVENEDGNIVAYPINNLETKVELNISNNWRYAWSNLETYDEKGKEIKYCVEEQDVPEQYYSVISFEDYEHYNITNYKYGSINIVKVDSKNNNIKLGGAEFKLEKLIEENGEVNIDENFEPIVLITSTEEENLGEVIFEKLEYGKYRLTEIKAPDGYNLQNKAIDIEITEENPDFVGNVINKTKTVLPSTGGNGSIVLTLLGVFCIAIAIKIKNKEGQKNMIKSKRMIALLLAVMLIISSMFTVVNATGDNTSEIEYGSLTITKLDNGRLDEEGNRLPLEGVKFKIYKVDNDYDAIWNIPEKYSQEGYDASNDENYYTAEATTGVNGTVKFENLKLGRYLVVEEESPINVVYKTANFLVDIPTTNADGSGLIYDVEVYPKTETVYGGIVLTKVNQKNEPMPGVKFILQTRNYRMADEGASLGLMENNPKLRLAQNDWKTVTELKGEERVPKELITDENGQITLQGLPEGEYRFIETETLEGYILDNSQVYEFEVYLGENSETIVEPEAIEVRNEKPGIEKTITSVSRNENDTNVVKDGNNSIDIGDIVSYKVVSDITSLYEKLNTLKITDTMDDGLTFLPESMVLKSTIHFDEEDIEDIVDETPLEEIAESGMITYTEHSWELNFVTEDTRFGESIIPSKVTLEIIYDARLNNDAVATSASNNNKAEIEYSTIVAEDYNGNLNTPIPTNKIESSAKIYTGGFNIEKRAISKDGELLGGAVFKIANSEEDARQGKFIKDANGKEIVLTTGNGENGTDLGKVSYKGLSYGTYYLLEVQAPTYTENGETKYYNLLKDPIKIAVEEGTYEGLANVIVNKKGTLLPSTGGMGALIFVVAGAIFITAGITYYRKNKKEEV